MIRWSTRIFQNALTQRLRSRLVCPNRISSMQLSFRRLGAQHSLCDLCRSRLDQGHGHFRESMRRAPGQGTRCEISNTAPLEVLMLFPTILQSACRALPDRLATVLRIFGYECGEGLACVDGVCAESNYCVSPE